MIISTEARAPAPPIGPSLAAVELAAGTSAAARVRLTAGVLAPRLLTADRSGARVALVATTATLLGGDVAGVRLVVGPGLHLEVVDVAATVAYNGRGRQARWCVEVELGEDASLVWAAEPLVLSSGAQVERSVTVVAAEGSTARLRDVLVLGRHGESGGSLTCRTRVTYAGRPLLAEDLALGVGSALDGLPGHLGGHRVVDTALAIGSRMRVADAGVPVALQQLDGPGTVLRWLGAEAHESPIPRLLG